MANRRGAPVRAVPRQCLSASRSEASREEELSRRAARRAVPLPPRCRGGARTSAPGAGEGERPGGDAVIVILLRGFARRCFVAATPVVKETRANPSGARRSRVRKEKIGSSTAPVVRRVRGRQGPSGRRPRPRRRNRIRSVFIDLRLNRSWMARAWPDHRRVVRRALPAPRQQRGALGDPLRLDEELGEGRVGYVFGDRSQAQLDVARELDLRGRSLWWSAGPVAPRPSSAGETAISRRVAISWSRRSKVAFRRGIRPGSCRAAWQWAERPPTRRFRSGNRAGRRTGCGDRACGRAPTGYRAAAAEARAAASLVTIAT